MKKVRQKANIPKKITFGLVRFTDNSFGIYNIKNITQVNDTMCLVKHKGTKFEAEIIATNDDLNTLNEMKELYSTELLIDDTNTIENLNPMKPTEHLQQLEQETTVQKLNIESSRQCISDQLITAKRTMQELIIHIEQQPSNISANSLDFSNISIGSEFIDFPNTSLFEKSILNANSEPNTQTETVDQEMEDGQETNEFEDVVDSIADKDYEPSEDDNSDEENDQRSFTEKENLILRDNSSLNIESSITSVNITNQNDLSACDDEKMYVEKSKGASGDKKYNCCYYCKKKQLKIARHLEYKHKDQSEVKNFVSLPKKSIERRRAIDVLRKKGNYIFNTNQEFNDGELIVSRRPRAKHNRTAKDFKACGRCKAFFSKHSLRAHFAICTGKSSKSHRLVTLMSNRAMRRVHLIGSDVVRNQLFPSLQDDEIVRLIRFDELVVLYANKMCEKYRDLRHHDMIRARIRLIGRFLSIVKKLNTEITDLTSVYDPKFSDDTLKAINLAGKFNHLTNCYETPTVPFQIGSLLKYIGNVLINESIKRHDEITRKNTENFLKLFDMDVAVSINRRVTESQIRHKRKTLVQLPLREDIKKLHFYLTKKREEAAIQVESSFSIESWTELAETTLSSIQLFNRRRAGEVERILIEDFNNHQRIDENTDKDIYASLSENSKQIAKKYVRFLITGKLYRTVPVILDNSLLHCVQLILKWRTKAKVPKTNPYVFGIGGRHKQNHLAACTLMRKFSTKCGAVHPERLRGTKLRKHIATICISLNLDENEVSDLANFMGHRDNIHKTIYRQPVLHRDILNMTKLLQVAQGDSDESDDELNDDELNNTNRDIELMPLEDPFQKVETPTRRKRSTSPYGPVKRRKWTDEEKKAVITEFRDKIELKKLPSVKEAENAVRRNKRLNNRTGPQLITWIHNHYKSNKYFEFF